MSFKNFILQDFDEEQVPPQISRSIQQAGADLNQCVLQSTLLVNFLGRNKCLSIGEVLYFDKSIL